MDVGCCVKAGGETLQEDQPFLPRSGGASHGSILALPLSFPFQRVGCTQKGVKVSISPFTPPKAHTEDVVHGHGRGAALR